MTEHNKDTNLRKVCLVTGSAGFIGFSLCKTLLKEQWKVIGVDNLNEYYDVTLKKKRESLLKKSINFHSIHASIEDKGVLENLFKNESPEIVIHLAAQAGVRFSIDNPTSYLKSNIEGTFELLEAARNHPPKHMLIASTSSIYGANKDIPYKESDKSDHQMSFYAATKKSTELLSHSYSHLFDLPVTMLRFFTVYGPWGRPDMALFKFTDSILRGKTIDVYNHGDMKRDFTFIDDLVRAIYLLIDVVPSNNESERRDCSPVAPFRVVNIGNSKSVKLMDFINAIELSLGITAKKNFIDMQAGDVKDTWADATLLRELTGYSPQTDIKDGVARFVEWYKDFYGI